MVLERAADGTRWQSLVERLSREGTHGSWRRAALLALVRSEIGPELLTRASGLLLANRASMLRELIRIVMAVDVEPASQVVRGCSGLTRRRSRRVLMFRADRPGTG